MKTATMSRPTITLDRPLKPAAKRIYDRALGKVRDGVVAGVLSVEDWQDAQADILSYLTQVFPAGIFAEV
jgi:hypothetical protein